MNNIVHISTALSSGSGFLLPCESYHKVNGGNSFIIFTNYHVVKDIVNKEKIEEYIDLEIYDDYGQIIDKSQFSCIELQCGVVGETSNDIAAIHIIVNDNYHVSVETLMDFSDVEDDILMYTEGYPGILINDQMNQKIILNGTSRNIYPGSTTMGIYKIIEDYHWYSNMVDKDLLDGLSGGPVYRKINDKNCLVGMNQSICNVEDGKNPFKFIYYIKVRQVLNYLRDQGIIIYEYLNHQVYIKWVYKKQYDLFENSKLGGSIDEKYFEKKILLIGGSGAGKSSITNALMLHKDYIRAIGDGQTTRTDIVYNLQVFCPKPKAKIEIRSRLEFSKEMKTRAELKILELLFTKLYNMHECNLENDALAYMRDFCIPLENIYKYYRDKDTNFSQYIDITVSDVKMLLGGNDSSEVEKIIIVYKRIIKILHLISIKEKSMKKIKYLFHIDRERIVKEDLPTEVLKDDLQNYEEKIINYKTNEDVKIDISDEVAKTDITNEVLAVLKKREGLFNVEEFYFLSENIRKAIDKLFSKVNVSKLIIYNFLNLKIEDSKEGVYGEVFKVDLDEYEEDDLEDKVEAEIEDEIEDEVGISDEDIEQIEISTDPIGKDENNHQTEKQNLLKLYAELYSILKRELIIYVNTTLKINRKKLSTISISLDNKNACKRILELCLMVENGMSLTGLIKEVSIHDSLSNEYVCLFEKLRISSIELFDTRGLDHIDKGVGIKRSIKDMIIKYREKEVPFDAIFYIKKLDSGRPTELESIIPAVYENEHSVPIYCVFTGIDIYCAGREQILPLMDWRRDDYYKDKNMKGVLYPKAVSHLYDNPGIFNRINSSTKRKEVVYKVLVNNLVALNTSQLKMECKNDEQFIVYNKRSLEKLFTSILNKEYSGMGFIDESSLSSIADSEKFNEALKGDIGKLFDKASIYKWNSKHHMTVRANVRRMIQSKREMGFNGAEIARWDCLFVNAYNEVFVDENSQMIQVLKSVYAGMEWLMGEIREKILGNSKELSEISYNEEEILKIRQKDREQLSFREIIVKMYRSKGNDDKLIYANDNPFSKEKFNLKRMDRETRNKFMENTCDFKKGLNGVNILDDLEELFKREIIDALNNLNKKNVERLICVDKQLQESIKKLNGTVNYMLQYLDSADMQKDVRKKIIDLILEQQISKV